MTEHAKSLFGILVLSALALFLSISCMGASTTYKISVTYVAASSDILEVLEPEHQAETFENNSSSSVGAQTVDNPDATITISHYVQNDDGGTDVVELAVGEFNDGLFEFEGEIDEAKYALVSVMINGEEFTNWGLVVPGGPEVAFALVQQHGFYPTDQLVKVGASRDVRDSTKKFSISGDFNSLDRDMSLAIARVSGSSWNEEGESRRFDTLVLLEEGRFLFEAETHEPSVWTVRIMESNDTTDSPQYFSMTSVVVEPKVDIQISSTRAGMKLLAASKTGRHAHLVDSWQQSEQYLATLWRYVSAYEERFGGSKTEQSEKSSQSDETDTNRDTTMDPEKDIGTVDDSTDEAKDHPSTLSGSIPILAIAEKIPPAEGCEHVVLEEVRPGILDASEDDPVWYMLSNELSNIRSNALDEIADKTSEPMNSLLALELGAFSDDKQKALSIYETLAHVLEDDFVARRVLTQRDELKLDVEVERNDKMLVPGQKVPDFELPTIDGNAVTLYEVLREKEVVLVDFWASWCGPCIVTFPELKKLHAAHNSDGFELVAISIDSTKKAWLNASDAHELPWINLGELEAWEGTTARAYGVDFIPKSYLVDSKGCILQKDIDSGTLAEDLNHRYRESPNLDESN